MPRPRKIKSKVPSHDNSIIMNNNNNNYHVLLLLSYLTISIFVTYPFYSAESREYFTKHIDSNNILTSSLVIVPNGMNHGLLIDLLKFNDSTYLKLNDNLIKALFPYLNLWYGDGSKVKELTFEKLGKLNHVFAGHLPGEWFIWPAIGLNHQQIVVNGGRNLTMKTVNMIPAVFQIDNFLTPDECNKLIKLSNSSFIPSRSKNNNRYYNTKDTFSSLKRSNLTDSSLLTIIDKRIIDLLKINIPALHQDLVVIHYKTGQSHFCHFDAIVADNKTHLTPPIVNRLYTILIYLNRPEKGGETGFPKAGYDGNPPYDNCSKLKFKNIPDIGRLVLFYNLGPSPKHMSGIVDNNSMHMGCMIEKGEKWAILKNGFNKQHNWRDFSKFTG